MPTLEQLFTHPMGFGITTATPVQRAMCRVADGLPLADLARDPSVVRMLGGEEALALLPKKRPIEVIIVAAIRCGKSLFSAALATRCALTCDLSDIPKHEIPRVPVLSLDKDKARVVMEHLLGAFSREILRPLVVDSKVLRDFEAVGKVPETFRLRREDGRIIEIVVAAGKRAGGSVVSRWTVSVIFDEAARMQGEEDGVVNFEQSYKAVIGRIVARPGAQLVAVSSPWAPRGGVYKAVRDDWGKPRDGRVVMRATGPEMNPRTWTPEAVEALRKQDESAYRTDVLGEFADPDTALLAAAQLKRASRATAEGVTTATMVVGAAMDPATRSNAWTFVIVGREPGATEAEDRLIVLYWRQWQGSKLEPVPARSTFREMAAELKPYRITQVWTDQWGYDPFRELAEDAGIELCLDPRTKAEETQGYMRMHARIVAEPEPLIELPPEADAPVLHADLLSLRKKLTPNGIVIDLPVTGDGRHCDFAPALNKACEVAATAGPSWVSYVQSWAQKGGHG